MNGIHLTQAYINLDNLTHNMNLLQDLVGKRSLWPAIKANGYGHGAEIIARHLIGLGYTTLCVAHASEAAELLERGLEALFVILSPTLPENSAYVVEYGFEPVVCTLEEVAHLAEAARNAGKRVDVHLKVDTGMGRVGIRPDEVTGFLDRCRNFPEVPVKAIMSHFPKADEEDKSFSLEQIRIFKDIIEKTREYGIEVYHFANSAAVFDLPEAHFAAARPGISIYGLKPSQTMLNPRVEDLKPVLEWKTRITFLKEVPAGTGLSYGHIYHADKPSLIATVPLGYGDGMSRLLSNKFELLVRGIRCPQVGRICMDQCLVDVTALRGRVKSGDEVVIIGRQGQEEVTADELALRLGTINYEIVTNLSGRVPRIAVQSP
jgi:alanine racemase